MWPISGTASTQKRKPFSPAPPPTAQMHLVLSLSGISLHLPTLSHNSLSSCANGKNIAPSSSVGQPGPGQGVNSRLPPKVCVWREGGLSCRLRESLIGTLAGNLLFHSPGLFIQPQQFSCGLFFLSHHRKTCPPPLPQCTHTYTHRPTTTAAAWPLPILSFSSAALESDDLFLNNVIPCRSFKQTDLQVPLKLIGRLDGQSPCLFLTLLVKLTATSVVFSLLLF